MDPSALGKLGNKVDETTSRKLAASVSTGSAAQGTAATSDTVRLTSGGQLLERLEKSLASLPDIDSARVAEVKAAIESGEYQIDADAIAAAMIRFEKAFGE